MAYTTLEDIAKRAGKSIATVSRVLNGKADSGIRIGEETRRLIEEIARELNYRPNYNARHLKKRGSRVIGLLIPDIMQIYFNEICYHLSRRLDERGYDLLLSHSYEEAKPERRALETILSRRVDGIIVAPASGKENLSLLREIRNEGIPLILLDRYFPGEEFHSVVTDDTEGSYKLTMHLLERGAKRVAFICGNRSTSVTIERLAGYRKAFAEAGISVDEKLIIESGYFNRDGYEAAFSLIERGLVAKGGAKKIDAIMGVNDDVAIGALKALWEYGLRVPDDVMVAGYGDERYSGLLKVPLTSVKQPTEFIADAAYRLLMQLLDNKIKEKSAKSINIRIPCKLVARESTGASVSRGYTGLR